jgi:cytochrome c553
MNPLKRSWTRKPPMTKLNSLVIICPFLLANILLFAQTQPSNLASNPVFQKSCAKCHGKTADGRFMGGPSLVSTRATSASADDLRNIITNGKGRMPKYAGKLSPEEIDTLVQQIKVQQIKVQQIKSMTRK